MSFYDFLAHSRFAHKGDLSALRRSQRRIGRKIRGAQRAKDTDQDARIAELEEDNVQLQLCIGGLLQLLASKGMLTPEEWLAIVETLQDEEDADAMERVDGGEAE